MGLKMGDDMKGRLVMGKTVTKKAVAIRRRERAILSIVALMQGNSARTTITAFQKEELVTEPRMDSDTRGEPVTKSASAQNRVQPI
ncbi:MAG: hypothetical protein AABO57_28795 [Acidobacteriota bacterium]